MSRTLPTHLTAPVILGVAFATGFSGAVVPGPLLAVVVAEAVRVGWAAGPLIMVGHAALELVAILLLVTGLIRFGRSARLRGVIGLVGALVLLYLGYETLVLSGPAGAEALARAGGGEGPGSLARLPWLGAVMSVANPYWWLWWATIGAAHTSWAMQRGRLGSGAYFVGHILSDVVWYCAVAAAIHAGRALLSPPVLRGIYLVCGAFLLVMAGVFGFGGGRALFRRETRTGEC